MPNRHLTTFALAASMIAGCGASSASLLSNASANLRLGALGSASQLELFTEPDAGVKPVIDAIDGATKCVGLEVYILTEPTVIEALGRAKARGLDVRVLMEHDPFNPADPSKPLPVNFKAANALKQVGVPYRWTSKKFTYTHEKSITIDNSTAVIMTANLSKSAFTKNREYGIIDRNPQDASQLAMVFEADWTGTATAISGGNLVVSPDNSRNQLEQLITSAKKSIVIEDEVAGDPAMFKLLGEKARAGVKVQVELAYFSSGKTNAEEKAQLAAAGVTEVRFLKSPVLHAKQVIVDGQRAYVGSINLTTNSMDNNREMGVIVNEPAIVGNLARTATEDWAAGNP